MSLSPSPIASAQAAGHASAQFDDSSLPMFATDGTTHVIRCVNAAFCRLLGRVEGALVGSPLTALARHQSQLPHDGNDAVALLDLVLANGIAEFGVDLAGVFGDIDAPHGLCAVWPIMGSDKRPGGLFIQVGAPNNTLPAHLDSGTGRDELQPQDINGRLLIASLLAQEQAEVQIALRNESDATLTALKELISIAAHELRTPATGIKLGMDLALRTLEETAPDTQRVVTYLQGTVGAANRLIRLLNDLMDISRMQSGRLLLRVRPVDLVELVRSVADRYISAASEQHHVTADLPTEPLMVAGDAVRLEQVLENLLSNAIKYSPDGGEICVRLQRVQDGIVLTVNDAGIGLTAEDQERIFEPFGRADNAVRRKLPGMGMGLHICRQIAAAHGGRMWAESAGEGLGLSVGVWFPLAAHPTGV